MMTSWRRPKACSHVESLMAPGLEAAVSDEYVSSHWLATFAWEAVQTSPGK